MPQESHYALQPNKALTVAEALERFYDDFALLCQASGWPELPFDEQWLSPCWLNEAEHAQLTQWKPVKQHQASSVFRRIEQALNLNIHPDVCSYYLSYWSEHMPARANQGDLTLLQVWNPEDLERLRGNLIGHALDKIRRKHPLTFFLATTHSDSDLIISLHNETGQVWLEAPGKKPHEKLADSLADFLSTLQPIGF